MSRQTVTPKSYAELLLQYFENLQFGDKIDQRTLRETICFLLREKIDNETDESATQGNI